MSPNTNTMNCQSVLLKKIGHDVPCWATSWGCEWTFCHGTLQRRGWSHDDRRTDKVSVDRRSHKLVFTSTENIEKTQCSLEKEEVKAPSSIVTKCSETVTVDENHNNDDTEDITNAGSEVEEDSYSL